MSTNLQLSTSLGLESMPRADLEAPEEAEHQGSPMSAVESPTKEQELQSIWTAHPENPFNWPVKQKWRQFLCGCLVTMLVGLNSTAIATPGMEIANQFKIDTGNPNLDNTVWPITAWNTGAAIGPMIGIPFLEAYGIKTGYLVSDP